MTDQIPTRLDLARGAVDWLDFVPNLDLIWASAAYALRKVAIDEDRTLEDRLHTYDKFIRQLLLEGYTDSTIYNAQWLWLMEQKEIEEKA
jgi:hypothetical protein